MTIINIDLGLPGLTHRRYYSIRIGYIAKNNIDCVSILECSIITIICKQLFLTSYVK